MKNRKIAFPNLSTQINRGGRKSDPNVANVGDATALIYSLA